METIRKIVHYLLNLQWTEKVQRECLFCDRKNFQNIVYEVFGYSSIPRVSVESLAVG